MLAVEILIMLGIYWLEVQTPDWKLALVDASLLAVIGATIAYFAFIRPKDRQISIVMAALEKARADAENRARYDELTGVLSRRALLEALQTEVEVAQLIAEQCRTIDHLGRYGGEEFLIILPETALDGAARIAERIRSAVAGAAPDRNEERVTLSSGVAEWRQGEGSASSLVSRADQALLGAKAAGRNRILVSQQG
jgi:PleD family two-component response regulator